MKKIEKGKSPEWFEKWKQEYFDRIGSSPRYIDLEGEDRVRLRDQLIKEQGYICCYCMRRISTYDSHIEHFKPRHPYTDLELDYYNMFASCTPQKDVIKESLLHCDAKKQDWFSGEMPGLTDASIEECIKYNIDGRVSSYHDRKDPRSNTEWEMIEHLGLNAPFLVRNRRRAICNSELTDDESKYEYSQEDWTNLIDYFMTRHSGKYEEFCNMFVQIISRECLQHQ